MRRIRVIDSHTGGEPTRIVVLGGPDLGSGPLKDRLRRFQAEHDRFRSAIVNEPRGSDVLVGGLITEPTEPGSVAGVIFFNNVGYLGMCGHGTIGLMATLAHLGRIEPGDHRIDTPVGTVTARWHGGGRTTVRNVPSYRLAANVRVKVPGAGEIRGDVAWGGNWFFLAEAGSESLSLDNLPRLTDLSWRIRHALTDAGITGRDGAEIDHVELFGPPGDARNHGRNFVLCPGGAYDRSPCGTGTSAKLACLVADGKLKPGDVWRQESILGSVFEGSVEDTPQGLVPSITGSAWISADAELLLDPGDPFCWGIR
jgi:4-hydroxyproline epimerase